MFEKLDVIDAEVASLAALSDGDVATHDGPELGDAILRLDTTIRRLEAVRLLVGVSPTTSSASSTRWSPRPRRRRTTANCATR